MFFNDMGVVRETPAENRVPPSFSPGGRRAILALIAFTEPLRKVKLRSYLLRRFDLTLKAARATTGFRKDVRAISFAFRVEPRSAGIFRVEPIRGRFRFRLPRASERADPRSIAGRTNQIASMNRADWFGSAHPGLAPGRQYYHREISNPNFEVRNRYGEHVRVFDDLFRRRDFDDFQDIH
jgi:hypothetical protein